MKTAKNKKSIFDFPPDAFDNMPGVYIYGVGEILIDGRAEIIEYSDNCVIFNLFYRGFCLKIEGNGLTMRCAGKNVSEINGTVNTVSYIKKSAL